MNCQDVITLLDSHPRGSLSPKQDERLAEHLLVCESCESALRASRMLRLLANEPVSSPRPDLITETLQLAKARSRRSDRRARPTWVGPALGAAIAASLAMIAVFSMLSSPSSGQIDSLDGVAIALNETRAITFAIDSAETLTDAEIHVVLAGGIGLESNPARRDFRWTANINAGINRLTLPLIALRDEHAEVLVEVGHGNQYRRLLLPIDVVPASAEDAPGLG